MGSSDNRSRFWSAKPQKVMIRYAELTWLVALLLLGIYEVWALATGNTTLSRAVWTLERGQYGPLLPFLVGILCGHFFWSGQ